MVVGVSIRGAGGDCDQLGTAPVVHLGVVGGGVVRGRGMVGGGVVGVGGVAVVLDVSNVAVVVVGSVGDGLEAAVGKVDLRGD